MKNLIITGNPKLTFIKITAPGGFSGNVMISGNEILNSMELIIPKFESQEDFKIENNPNLTTLDLSAITDFRVKKQLVVTNNKDLASFVFDNVNEFVVNGGWSVVFRIILAPGAEISKNNNLEKIYIKNASPFKLLHLKVEKNRKLKTIGDKFQSTQLFVHGNPSLEPSTLLTLNSTTTAGNDIQPEGGFFLLLNGLRYFHFRMYI